MKKGRYMMKIGRKHTQEFCIKPDYWGGGHWPPGPPGSYSTAFAGKIFNFHTV